MHFALTIVAVLGLIAFAFGERTAVFVARVALGAAGCAGLFFLYVLFCAMRT